jgi:hypothetical protein
MYTYGTICDETVAAETGASGAGAHGERAPGAVVVMRDNAASAIAPVQSLAMASKRVREDDGSGSGLGDGEEAIRRTRHAFDASTAPVPKLAAIAAVAAAAPLTWSGLYNLLNADPTVLDLRPEGEAAAAAFAGMPRLRLDVPDDALAAAVEAQVMSVMDSNVALVLLLNEAQWAAEGPRVCAAVACAPAFRAYWRCAAAAETLAFAPALTRAPVFGVPSLIEALLPARVLLGARHHVSEELVEDMSIGLILNVTRDPPALPGITRSLPVNDDAGEDITRVCAEARALLDEASARGVTVLVHCAAGVSRSGSVVVDYVRARLGLRDAHEALARVRASRPQVAPNTGFMRQLCAMAQ